MALQINQYAVTETGPIDADSLFDIDAETAPATYESRKLPFSTLQSEVLGGLTADNGVNKSGSTIKLGGNLLANTVIDGSVGDFSLELRGGSTGVGNALSSIDLNNGTGVIDISQVLASDPSNEFSEFYLDLPSGISRMVYRSPTTDDHNSINFGDTGIVLRTDDNLGGNAMTYTQFNGIGTFLGAAGSLRYQDGSEGTIGHVLQSVDVNGSMAWAAVPAGPNLYNTSDSLTANRVIDLNGNTLDIEGGSLSLNTNAPLEGYFLNNSLNNNIFKVRENNTTNDASIQLLSGDGANVLVSLNNATDFFNTGKNFGIRTNNPLANLHLTASAHNNGFSLYQVNGTTLAAKLNHVVNATSMASSFTMYEDNGTTAGIQLGGASASYSFINDGNDFGIGVTAPNEKLEVGGRIRANSGFNFNGTNGVTQTGSYTNFTIEGGIITAAS